LSATIFGGKYAAGRRCRKNRNGEIRVGDFKNQGRMYTFTPHDLPKMVDGGLVTNLVYVIEKDTFYGFFDSPARKTTGILYSFQPNKNYSKPLTKKIEFNSQIENYLDFEIKKDGTLVLYLFSGALNPSDQYSSIASMMTFTEVGNFWKVTNQIDETTVSLNNAIYLGIGNAVTNFFVFQDNFYYLQYQERPFSSNTRDSDSIRMVPSSSSSEAKDIQLSFNSSAIMKGKNHFVAAQSDGKKFHFFKTDFQTSLGYIDMSQYIRRYDEGLIYKYQINYYLENDIMNIWITYFGDINKKRDNTVARVLTYNINGFN